MQNMKMLEQEHKNKNRFCVDADDVILVLFSTLRPPAARLHRTTLCTSTITSTIKLPELGSYNQGGP